LTAAVSIAPASERTLSAGAYLGGAVELAALALALAFGARRVRRLLLPGWSGPPAILCELILAAVGLIWISEALGTVGAFSETGVLIGSIVVGVGAGVIAGRLATARRPAPAPAPPAPAGSTIATVIAAVACAVVVGVWMIPVLGTLAAGMDRADTLWYHMPLAARFVQTGYLSHIYFFDPVFLASFYPANSEVFHAVPILDFGRDIASPVINLGWLGVALLAAWCIGRPYGRAPESLIGASIVLGSQSLVEFQAGEALNDITGLAFVLAAAAILVNGYAASTNRAVGTGRSIGSPALAVAALAAGLAAGVKLSFLAPVAALTVGVIVIGRRGQRLRTALVWLVPAIAAGGYWYARNLFAVGNPIPYVRSLGPITLPGPDRDFHLLPPYSVFHYWNDTSVWTHRFGPGLHESFGPLWFIALLAVAGAAVYALWRVNEPVVRVLGAMVIVTVAAYVVTPYTAAGYEGAPIAFVWNLRYLAPAAAVGLAILPCLPALRSTPRRRGIVLAGLAIVLATTVESTAHFHPGHRKGVYAGVLAVLAAAAGYAWLRSRGWVGPRSLARTRIALASGIVVLAVGAGYAMQVHYLEHRYENTGDTQDLDQALRWSRDVRDARIAIGGIRGVFAQYPFYGTDLSNTVQWLGRRQAADGYERIRNCEKWRQAIDAGGYDYVVTTFDPYLPGDLRNSPEGRWTGTDPNAKAIVTEGPVRVFAVHGPLDASSCDGLKPLTRAQLRRVPNLRNHPSRR
jgi:hypothetical protein